MGLPRTAQGFPRTMTSGGIPGILPWPPGLGNSSPAPKAVHVVHWQADRRDAAGHVWGIPSRTAHEDSRGTATTGSGQSTVCAGGPKQAPPGKKPRGGCPFGDYATHTWGMGVNGHRSLTVAVRCEVVLFYPLRGSGCGGVNAVPRRAFTTRSAPPNCCCCCCSLQSSADRCLPPNPALPFAAKRACQGVSQAGGYSTWDQ